MRAAKASGPPLRYYGNETAEADEKRGAVEDTEGRVAAQDFSGKSPTTLAQIALCARSARTPARWPRGRRGSAVRVSPRADR